MLKEAVLDEDALVEAKDACLEELGWTYESFFEVSDDVTALHFPVRAYPEKVKSTKLDKEPFLEGVLQGVKGQYWIFEDGRVWNVRSHAGYRVEVSVN